MRYTLACLICLFAACSALGQSKAKIAFGLPVLQDDRSLTLADYEKAGVPSIKIRWGLTEYQQAAKALLAIAEKDASHLPRENSPRSGMLLKHLFDTNNFPKPAESKTLEQTEAALVELRELSGGPLIAITDAYMLSLDQGFSQPNELCAAIGFVTQVLPVAHELAAQAATQGRPQDPARTAALEESSVNAIVSAVALLRHVGDKAVGAKGALLGRVAPAYRAIQSQLSIPSDTKVQIIVEKAMAWEISEPILTQLGYMQTKPGG